MRHGVNFCLKSEISFCRIGHATWQTAKIPSYLSILNKIEPLELKFLSEYYNFVRGGRRKVQKYIIVTCIVLDNRQVPKLKLEIEEC